MYSSLLIHSFVSVIRVLLFMAGSQLSLTESQADFFLSPNIRSTWSTFSVKIKSLCWKKTRTKFKRDTNTVCKLPPQNKNLAIHIVVVPILASPKQNKLQGQGVYKDFYSFALGQTSPLYFQQGLSLMRDVKMSERAQNAFTWIWFSLHILMETWPQIQLAHC